MSEKTIKNSLVELQLIPENLLTPQIKELEYLYDWAPAQSYLELNSEELFKLALSGYSQTKGEILTPSSNVPFYEEVDIVKLTKNYIESIPPVPDFIKKPEEKLKYAILDSNNNYNSIEEVAEMHAASGVYITDCIAFKPNRILDHEILIGLSTSVKIANAGELDYKLMTLYNELKEEFLKNNPNFENNIDQARLRFLNNLNLTPEESEELHKSIEKVQISRDYSPGKYAKGIPLDEVKKQLAIGSIINQFARTQAQKGINTIIDQKVKKGELEYLTKRKVHERIVLSANGGIASGKGSSINILEHNYKNGIWSNDERKAEDNIKISGDTYKAILNQNYEEDQKLFSQLVQDEASYVGNQIFNRSQSYLENNPNGEAPDMLIDKVMLPDNWIQSITSSGSSLRGIVVSTNVNDSLERAKIRGDQTGRYERSAAILDSHAKSPVYIENLFKLTENLSTKSEIVCSVMDNNVNRGEQPTKVCDIDYGNKYIKIYDKMKMRRFINKNNTLPSDNIITYDTFINKLQKKGYNLEVIRSDEELHAEANARQDLRNNEDIRLSVENTVKKEVNKALNEKLSGADVNYDAEVIKNELLSDQKFMTNIEHKVQGVVNQYLSETDLSLRDKLNLKESFVNIMLDKELPGNSSYLDSLVKSNASLHLVQFYNQHASELAEKIEKQNVTINDYNIQQKTIKAGYDEGKIDENSYKEKIKSLNEELDKIHKQLSEDVDKKEKIAVENEEIKNKISYEEEETKEAYRHVTEAEHHELV